jgi:hypothetical protein
MDKHMQMHLEALIELAEPEECRGGAERIRFPIYGGESA